MGHLYAYSNLNLNLLKGLQTLKQVKMIKNKASLIPLGIKILQLINSH